MSILTITVDDDTLQKAEMRAKEEGSSIDEVLRKLLASYARATKEQLAALETSWSWREIPRPDMSVSTGHVMNCMTDPFCGAGDAVLFDTNVLVYAVDHSALEKGAVARPLLADCIARGEAHLSTQVLQEFFVIVTRKITTPSRIAKRNKRFVNSLRFRSSTRTRALSSTRF